MEKQEQIKTILGISLLYVMITSVFSLINKLCSLMLSQNNFGVKIRFFLQDSLLWIVVAAAIIITFILYLKKLNQGAYFDLFRDSFVRVTAGTLAVIDGIIHLSVMLPLYVTSIQSAIQSSQLVQQSMQRMLTEMILSDVISVFLFLCQVLVGIYLIKFHSKTA